MRALRTTLILGGFWLVIILAGGYLIQFRLKDQQTALKEREAKAREELAMAEELVANLPALQMDLQYATRIWEYRSKAIPRREASHETYGYLDVVLSRNPTTLNFDFLSVSTGDSAGVHSANYKLMGEARFADLYAFIWYMEHLPRYLRINTLDLEETQARGGGGGSANRWVRFEMNVTAMSADRPGLDDTYLSGHIAAPPAAYDPFLRPYKPVAAALSGSSIPANVRNLPNVYESIVKALTPTLVYIVDQKGDLKVLNLGDEVYLGHLIDVLPEEKRAVFELDQLNPPRQISLKMTAEK
jgi:hypothetical protein